jgi:hypothetical protein
MKVRHNIFASHYGACEQPALLSYYPLIGQFCRNAYLNSENYHNYGALLYSYTPLPCKDNHNHDPAHRTPTKRHLVGPS